MKPRKNHKLQNAMYSKIHKFQLITIKPFNATNELTTEIPNSLLLRKCFLIPLLRCSNQRRWQLAWETRNAYRILVGKPGV